MRFADVLSSLSFPSDTLLHYWPRQQDNLAADVVFLPNDHDNPHHFECQVAAINRHFQYSDILLIEAPESSDYFIERKQKFQERCGRVVHVVGWADAAAFEEACNIKRAEQELSAESEGTPSFIDKVRDITARIFSCLIRYQMALISKIQELLGKKQRLFVDVGAMHVDEGAAISAGYYEFVPEIQRLRLSLAQKKVVQIHPDRSIGA